MMQAELLARQLDDTRDWTNKLLADLRGDDWGFQPGEGLAHPLWLCGHLATSQDTLIHVRCLDGGVMAEAFRAHFPIGQPVRSVREHAYPAPEEVLSVMREVHDATLAVVRSMSDDLLVEPAMGAGGRPHPHYQDKAGAVSHCARHEAFHAGQIAMIRRLLGKSFLR